jgi:hypothetical protein
MTIGRIPSVEGGIQPTIVDAKGDLIAATAADTVNRLAVGSNDQILVADSSTSTGLAWKSNATPFAAGKNKIINGDFYINQRNFTSSTALGYTFDRWALAPGSDGTTTCTPQTFTLGAAPVAGYEGKTFIQLAVSGQTLASASSLIYQKIEDVRTLANQTVTVSFWARATSGTPKIAVEFEQNFGTGGSPSSAVLTYVNNVTLSTSWARYSVTASIPSISGKTIGTANDSYLTLVLWVSAGSNFNSRTGSIGIQNNTFQIWGVQAENGSVATAFQTATGTLQGELAACQRYYTKSARTATAPGDGNNYDTDGIYATNATHSTTGMLTQFFAFPVSMRVAPTMTFFRTNLSATNGRWAYYNGAWVSATTTTGASISDKGFSVNMDGSYTINSVYPIAGAFAASAEL